MQTFGPVGFLYHANIKVKIVWSDKKKKELRFFSYSHSKQHASSWKAKQQDYIYAMGPLAVDAQGAHHCNRLHLRTWGPSPF